MQHITPNLEASEIAQISINPKNLLSSCLAKEKKYEYNSQLC